jgi:hypothetical protein
VAWAAREDMMTLKFIPAKFIPAKFQVAKFSAANKPAALLAAFAVVAIAMTPAGAQTKRRNDDRPAYTTNGPNSSYQQGPRTRIYVTKRTWLDGGTEVLPGDRKFTDYAYPPGQSFGMQNNNRPLDRQPLNPASDMGGYPRTFPLY